MVSNVAWNKAIHRNPITLIIQTHRMKTEVVLNKRGNPLIDVIWQNSQTLPAISNHICSLNGFAQSLLSRSCVPGKQITRYRTFACPIFKSLWHNGVKGRRCTKSALLQIVVCHRFYAKLLRKPVLIYPHPVEDTSVKFEPNPRFFT